MSALMRLGLRLAGGGGARERVRSLSVAAAAAAGTWALLVTLSVVDAALDTLGQAYGDQEMAVLATGVLVAVGVPVVVLGATASRLSASVRDRRLASLRLIGLPPTSTRLVAAVEVGRQRSLARWPVCSPSSRPGRCCRPYGSTGWWSTPGRRARPS